MGLKMSPGSVTAQLDAKNKGMNLIIDNAQKVLSEISALEESTDQLQGKSYDSFRKQNGHAPDHFVCGSRNTGK